jgi:hypothetical protein
MRWPLLYYSLYYRSCCRCLLLALLQEVKSLRQHVQTCLDEIYCFCFTDTSKAQEVKSLRQHVQTCLDEMAAAASIRVEKVKELRAAALLQV